MKAFAVLLIPNVPQEIVALLEPYLETAPNSKVRYFYSFRAESNGYFLECSAVKAAEKDKPWNVQVPIGFILAIAEVGEEPPKYGAGFLAKF